MIPNQKPIEGVDRLAYLKHLNLYLAKITAYKIGREK